MSKTEMKEGTIVHYMQFGHTACLVNGPPNEWPENHRWTSVEAEVSCPACIEGLKWGESTFEILEDGTRIKCRRCGRVSSNLQDVEYHYCGHCHAYHDDIWPPARKAWMEGDPKADQSAQVAAGAAEELRSTDPIAITFQPEALFCMIAALQLALRHPKYTSPSRAVVERFIQETKQEFGPLTQQMIEMGNDPKFDQ